MRSERNRLRSLWRRDPREPGSTIMLTSSDEATCRAWASRDQNVVVEFADKETALACYRSAEYQAAKIIRQKYADADFIIIDGAS